MTLLRAPVLGRWAVVIVVLVVAAAGLARHLHRARAAGPPPKFTAYTPDLAYRVVPAARTACPSDTACWNLKVRARAGCPDQLRVEIAVARPDGTIIDTATDQVGPVPPGGTTLLRPRLPVTTPGETGTLASITCR